MGSEVKFKLAIFASGSGTNAEAIMRHFQLHPDIRVALVLTNNSMAMVLQRALKFQVRTSIFDKTAFRETGEVLRSLQEAEVTHVVLAGFLWLIPHEMISAYPNKIINIHPSILPKYGGKGMYGDKVHMAVKSSHEEETGISIHLVNEYFDEGKILFQSKCKIDPTDSIDQIASKVHQLEHTWYPKIIEQWILGKLV